MECIALSSRDERIDRMKGFLCIAMLLAHALFSFGYEETGSRLWKLVSHAVNLTAFSGFLFCFGFVCERAYLSVHDRARVSGRLVKRFFIILAAYYICGLAACLFDGGLDAAALTGLFHLTALNGLTYLLAFALLFLLLWLFYKPLDQLLGRGWPVALGIAVSLVLAALPAVVPYLPAVSLFIKLDGGSGFPVLPYFGYFLLGAFLSRRQRSFDWRVGLFALGTFLVFAARLLYCRALPQRFPPSLSWVLGGYLPVYALYLVAGCCKKSFWNTVLSSFGKHTLYYLTASNILLAAYGCIAGSKSFLLPRPWYFPAYLLLLALSYGLFWLYQSAVKKKA